MTIRSATPEDINRCCDLLALLFEQEDEFTPDLENQKKGLQLILENPSSGTVLVYEDNEKGCIAGMVVMLYTISTALGEKVALFEDMIVDPAYRSQGIGSRLLQHAVSLAREAGLGRITLLTDENNVNALDFYNKNGFRRSSMVVFRKRISSTQ